MKEFLTVVIFKDESGNKRYEVHQDDKTETFTNYPDMITQIVLNHWFQVHKVDFDEPDLNEPIGMIYFSRESQELGK